MTAGAAGGSGSQWDAFAPRSSLIVDDLEAIKRANAAFETSLAKLVGEIRALSESTLQDHVRAITGNAAVVTAMFFCRRTSSARSRRMLSRVVARLTAAKRVAALGADGAQGLPDFFHEFTKFVGLGFGAPKKT